MTQVTDPAEIARIFDAESRVDEEALEAQPRYNVAPTQPLTVVLQRGDEGRFVEQHRWGLVPSFATSLKEGAKRINARAETVATSPAFRASFARRRCIVPSDGFYEWYRPGGASARGAAAGGRGGAAQPFFLRPPEDGVLAMAGLWAVWKDPDTGLWVPSAAVITTRANGLVGEIHDRMPVLLPREAWDAWLDPGVDDAGYLVSLLEPAPDDVLTMYPISRAVNDVRNEGPELLEPVGVGLDVGSSGAPGSSDSQGSSDSLWGNPHP
jgi:putative SOS response-associated peptidase YedK